MSTSTSTSTAALIDSLHPLQRDLVLEVIAEFAAGQNPRIVLARYADKGGQTERDSAKAANQFTAAEQMAVFIVGSLTGFGFVNRDTLMQEMPDVIDAIADTIETNAHAVNGDDMAYAFGLIRHP